MQLDRARDRDTLVEQIRIQLTDPSVLEPHFEADLYDWLTDDPREVDDEDVAPSGTDMTGLMAFVQMANQAMGG